MATTVSILGCGWLGLPLAGFLVSKGYIVKGSTTREEKLDRLKQAGVQPFLLNFTPHPQREQLDYIPDFLKTDILIIAIPPQASAHGEDFHPMQILHLSEHLKLSDINKIIYISSTSIYPDKGEVTEETDISSEQTNNAPLRRAEEILCGLHRRPTILRCGGLMGYDRIPGKYFIGKKDLTTGEVPVNFVHRDDVIGIIYQVIKQDKWGDVYNVVAPEHPRRKDIYTSNARDFGWEAPTFLEGTTPDYKVVNSTKVAQELNYTFAYPDPITFAYDKPAMGNA
jgi:nucleoside-diphosphate-sugar epimerase